MNFNLQSIHIYRLYDQMKELIKTKHSKPKSDILVIITDFIIKKWLKQRKYLLSYSI